MESLEKILRNNYPDGYINHYLAMYSVHQKEFSSENFENQNAMYVACEGKDEFQNLKNEVIKVRQQADLELFLKLAITYKIEDINIDNLTKMFEAIEKFRI